jgi:hypothetical protein
MFYLLFIVTSIIVYFGGKADAFNIIRKQCEKDGKFSIGKEVFNCTKIDKVCK